MRAPADLDELLAGYQTSARRNGVPWSLIRGDFARLTQEPCHFCRIPPLEFPGAERETYAHGEVGRIDSADGFTPDNSIPCCQICARRLAASSYDEHMEWLHRVAAFQALERIESPDDMFGPQP